MGDPVNNFDEWFKENKSYLESNNVTSQVARIIWDSAKASATHEFVKLVHAGKLKVNLN